MTEELILTPTPQPRWHNAGYQPGYVVLFDSVAGLEASNDAFFHCANGNPRPPEIDTLDPEVARASKALWYCLHLPRFVLDTYSLRPSELDAIHYCGTAQRILLAPYPAIISERGSKIIADFATDLILCPDGATSEAQTLAERSGASLGVTSYSSLSQSSLDAHWAGIADLAGAEAVRRTGICLCSDLATAAAILPAAFIAHHCGLRESYDLPAADVPRRVIELQVLFEECLQIERAGRRPTTAEQRTSIHVKAATELSLPVVATLARETSANGGRKSDGHWPRRWEDLDQLSAADLCYDGGPILNFLAAHTALGQNAAVVQARQVPNTLYEKLAQLEDHCKRRPRGRVVQRLLRSIGDETGNLFDKESQTFLRRASRLIVHSNFPVGLAILPGDSAPLACQMPVSCRPIVPLTRALQLECLGRAPVYLGDTFRVLIAECLAPDDPIAPTAASGWKVVREQLASLPKVSVEHRHFGREQDLASALRKSAYDVLVLSAHGVYDTRRNYAGVIIGDDVCLGLQFEYGSVPPLVLLSACHVSPRGAGAVTIADLLVRQGAHAVLGTLAPVNVHRNAVLMARLFLYVAESIVGNEPHRNVAEAWDRTATSNAIHDLLSTIPFLRAISGELSFEFMTKWAPDRLRRSHIYEDTIAVLGEMLAEKGLVQRFRATLASQSYLPETLLYTFTGSPETILLRPPPAVEQRGSSTP